MLPLPCFNGTISRGADITISDVAKSKGRKGKTPPPPATSEYASQLVRFVHVEVECCFEARLAEPSTVPTKTKLGSRHPAGSGPSRVSPRRGTRSPMPAFSRAFNSALSATATAAGTDVAAYIIENLMGRIHGSDD